MTHAPSVRALSTLVAALAAASMGATMLAGAASGANSICAPPHYPGNGYFTSLKVHGTSCATGRRVAVAWYRCRTKQAPSGRCHQKILGFSCTEKRITIPTEIDARVTCRRHGRTVVHTYQQNT